MTRQIDAPVATSQGESMRSASGPRTEAGKLLDEECGDQLIAGGSIREHILAIEAEAAERSAADRVAATPRDSPDPATVEEIAAGIAELGTGGTPAYIRGYNRGFDDGWAQAREEKP
jgi:hypothetical protein